MPQTVNTVQVGNYIVSGDIEGQVTVTEVSSGEVIRTFVMDEGVVVREIFLLDGRIKTRKREASQYDIK